MDKAKIMQFISDSIDNGARIEVFFHGQDITQEDARKTSHQFAELVNGRVEDIYHDRSSWYKVKTEGFQLDCFYQESDFYLEEDVDLTGGEEHVTV